MPEFSNLINDSISKIKSELSSQIVTTNVNINERIMQLEQSHNIEIKTVKDEFAQVEDKVSLIKSDLEQIVAIVERPKETSRYCTYLY